MIQDNQSDEKLLTALQSGVEDQYNAALRYLHDDPKLHNTIRKLIFDLNGTEADVNDAKNYALCRFFQKVIANAYIAEKSQIRTFIAGVARKRYITNNRSRQRFEFKRFRLSLLGGMAKMEEPDADMADSDRRSLVAKMLNLVEPKCQQLLRLHAARFKHAEIAQKFTSQHFRRDVA